MTRRRARWHDAPSGLGALQDGGAGGLWWTASSAPKGRCCCSVTRYFSRRAPSLTNAHLSPPRASAAVCDRLRRARATPASQCSSPSRLARYVAHCSRELATWQVTLVLSLDTVPRAPTAALPDPEHWPPLNEHRCVRGAAPARDEPAVTTHTKCLTVTHSDTGRRREAMAARPGLY